MYLSKNYDHGAAFIAAGTDLKVSHHDQPQRVTEAGHQAAGVDPTVMTVLYDLSIAQQAHHHH